jgi:hypothetical protein
MQHPLQPSTAIPGWNPPAIEPTGSKELLVNLRFGFGPGVLSNRAKNAKGGRQGF